MPHVRHDACMMDHDQKGNSRMDHITCLLQWTIIFLLFRVPFCDRMIFYLLTLDCTNTRVSLFEQRVHWTLQRVSEAPFSSGLFQACYVPNPADQPTPVTLITASRYPSISPDLVLDRCSRIRVIKRTRRGLVVRQTTWFCICLTHRWWCRRKCESTPQHEACSAKVLLWRVRRTCNDHMMERLTFHLVAGAMHTLSKNSLGTEQCRQPHQQTGLVLARPCKVHQDHARPSQQWRSCIL